MKNAVLFLLNAAASLLLFSNCSEPSTKPPLQAAPEFTFQLTSDTTSDPNVKRVRQIIVRYQGQIVQTLDGFQAEVQANEEVTFEDVNFDGQADIRLMQYLPAFAEVPYFYWLYDAARKQFVRNFPLEAVVSPMLDPAQKIIISQWRESDSLYGNDYYRFVKNDLVLLKQEIFDASNSVIKKTVKETINGNSTTVSNTSVEDFN